MDIVLPLVAADLGRYLTLQRPTFVADVTAATRLVDGRAIRPREAAEDHPDWIAQAATALGMDPLDYCASVSPSILARDGVRLTRQSFFGVVQGASEPVDAVAERLRGAGILGVRDPGTA